MQIERRRSPIRRRVREILYGRNPSHVWVSDFLLALNVFIIFISLGSLVFGAAASLVYLELAFGIIFGIEYFLRFWVSRHKTRFVFRLVNIVDVVVIGSLLATAFVPNLAFLRILRAVQVLRAYKIFRHRFDTHNEFIYRNYEVVTATMNVLIFLFIMSTVVYVQQVGINSDINNYVDALYYTIATVTTTGFGDIVVQGTWGKLLSIIIMILGVTLFFRLVKSLFIPRQLYSVCSGCGNDHHALDAHYCGHCGHKIKNRYYAERFKEHKNDF